MKFDEAVQKAVQTGNSQIYRASKAWHRRGINTDIPMEDRVGDDWEVVDMPVKTKFELGRLLSTATVAAEIPAYDLAQVISRHRVGDWGQIDEDDFRANDRAVIEGKRILSVYTFGGKKLYVLTEADRSMTTVMFANEY